MRKPDIIGNPLFWRYSTYFWTIILFFIVVYDFVTMNVHTNIVTSVAAIYTAVLGIYSADKEFSRWHHLNKGRKPHPGEVFVILWTVLIVGIIFASFFFDRTYTLPKEITATYIVVLGILVITGRSKQLFLDHENACRMCDEFRQGH